MGIVLFLSDQKNPSILMAANSWAPGHGCISANANLADLWYSVLGTQAVVLKRPLFSSLPAANAEQAVVLPVPDCHGW